ncbi:hypothetical protein FJTKL_01094 [Diaporthe vaccinii]|uniref:Uncharacterized protein n=1 Tax=Diaporthe vaccinii TaxID=105482 RepID=A0ABR4F517_9PEZI
MVFFFGKIKTGLYSGHVFFRTIAAIDARQNERRWAAVFSQARGGIADATPRLIFYCLVYAMGSIFFGYDGASFGGVQAMTPFINKFGAFSQTKRAYYLPSRTASLMNSLPLLGKFTGTVIVGPTIELFRQNTGV